MGEWDIQNCAEDSGSEIDEDESDMLLSATFVQNIVEETREVQRAWKQVQQEQERAEQAPPATILPESIETYVLQDDQTHEQLDKMSEGQNPTTTCKIITPSIETPEKLEGKEISTGGVSKVTEEDKKRGKNKKCRNPKTRHQTVEITNDEIQSGHKLLPPKPPRDFKRFRKKDCVQDSAQNCIKLNSLTYEH